ncbi:prepilin peptidase [Sphingomonas oligophenolica]|uniref:Prepilin peptidase n=1 Tax=Sphingomonas oligophenolica TaxID=301154 RepID=A0ABU9XZ14_9SPHN
MGGVLNALLVGTLVLLLVSAGIQDARTREIANWKNAAIALLAPLWWWSHGLALWPDMIQLFGIAAAVFALFCVAFHFGWMGGGDVKMIGALSLWFFWIQSLAEMLIVMSLIGGAITLLLMIERTIRKNTAQIEIPYGVAIAIAALLVIREPNFNQFL